MAVGQTWPVTKKAETKDPDRCERLALSTETKRRLWAESGGYCQRPECPNYLFPDESEVDFAEMAHIVAATTGGARDVDKKEMSETDRAHHSNIAVLCANCHTVVDKDPDNHPIDMMRAWKARHQQALEQALGTPHFEDRASARAYVEPRLSDNRTVFLAYGPIKDDFSEDRAHQWRQLAVSRLVPNNAEIERALRVNRHLLTPDERAIADRFSLHQEQFAARHVLQDYSASATLYPEGMDDIFKDGP